MAEWRKRQMNITNFHESVMELISKLPKNKYKTCFGIPRGGLVVATYISHHLDIELISCRKKFDKTCMGLMGGNDHILVVDDIADTGETLAPFVSWEFDTATLFWKERSIVKPTYYIHETIDWVVFPYERYDEEPNREK